MQFWFCFSHSPECLCKTPINITGAISMVLLNSKKPYILKTPFKKTPVFQKCMYILYMYIYTYIIIYIYIYKYVCTYVCICIYTCLYVFTLVRQDAAKFLRGDRGKR